MALRDYFTKKRIIYGLAAVALVGFGVYFFVRSKTPQVATLTVHYGPFVNQVSVTGKVVPEHTVDLGFEESGKVAEVYADVGAHVVAGTILATLENNDLRATVGQRWGLLETQRALLNEAQNGRANNNIGLLQSAFLANGNTFAGGGFAFQNPDAQRGEVTAAFADLLNAQALLNKTVLIAPFTGVVTKMDLKPGSIVNPSGDTMVSMMSDAPFEIETYVPEIYIGTLRIGNTASTTLDAYGDSVNFNARVISIDPAETVQNNVSTYKVKLRFSGADVRIKSGMTANIIITTQTKPHAIAVPSGVVMSRRQEHYVQVQQGNSIIDRPVTLGNTSNLGIVEITSGLSDGDEVVLNPT